jgi:hypothetical protein
MRKQYGDHANNPQIQEAEDEKTSVRRRLVNINHSGFAVCGGGIFENLGHFGGSMEQQIRELGVSGGISACNRRS